MGPLGVRVLPIGGGVNLDFGTNVGSHDVGDEATPGNLGWRSSCSGICHAEPEAPEQTPNKPRSAQLRCLAQR